MWEEKGTDEIDADGHENWDKSWTTNNEVSLWWLNDSSRENATNVINLALCAGKSNNLFLN